MANFFDPLAQISENSSIDISTRGTHTYVGAHSVIDDFVRIKHVGGVGHIRLGEYVYLNSGTVLYSGNGIEIGNHVLIGPNCNLVPANHEIKNPNELIRLQKFMTSKGGIVIEDDVWLGANVTLLDGVRIRKGAVIGANSLVTGEVESYSIYVGIPAKKVASRIES